MRETLLVAHNLRTASFSILGLKLSNSQMLRLKVELQPKRVTKTQFQAYIGYLIAGLDSAQLYIGLTKIKEL